MEELKNKTGYCGIDVSKLSFDVYCQDRSYVYENSAKGFKALKRIIDVNVQCVMEATGPYYLKLAVYLYQHGVKVSVINPLVIKRFGQMRMIRAKTDKADAKLIALYAEREAPKLWTPQKSVLLEIQQTQAVLDGLHKQRRMLKNQLGAIQVQPFQSKESIKVLKQMIKKIENHYKTLERTVLLKVQKHFNEEYELLTSIPGIGIKTAIALLVATDSFSKFDSSKKLASYVGICPRIFQSGSSVKGKGHITKMGGSRIRALLYMGACSAKKYNKACRELFDRLVAKGKAKKLALIAVANKLLKQAYAVVTKQKMYHEQNIIR